MTDPVYNEIPQEAIDRPEIARADFGQYVRDNFRAHYNTLQAMNTKIGDRAAMDPVYTEIGKLRNADTTFDSRLGPGVTTANTATAQLDSIRSSLGSSTTEGGQWQIDSPEGVGKFFQGAARPIPMNTVIRSPDPAYIVNNNNGNWRINRAGWWDFTAVADLAMPADLFQEWIFNITNTTQNIKIAASQFFWVKNAYTDGTATGFCYCNTGDNIRLNGIFYNDIAQYREYWLVSQSRSNFIALYRGS